MVDNEAAADKEQTAGTVTRREWMLRLGEVVALLGTSGSDVFTVAAAAQAQSLPPGLYLPSNEHLSHALTANQRYHPIPPGSETDYVQPRSGPYQPLFFSPPEFATVRRLIELLLGATSGETAVVDEVAAWIDWVVFHSKAAREAAAQLAPAFQTLATAYEGSETELRRLQTFDPQAVCRDGLDWLQRNSEPVTASAGQQGAEPQRTAFLSLNAERRLKLLDSISDARPERSQENPGTRLFSFLKAETVRGFYTSQVGLKELDYRGNYFYAESPGCDRKRADTAEQQGAWLVKLRNADTPNSG